jgi:hypothetical protein
MPVARRATGEEAVAHGSTEVFDRSTRPACGPRWEFRSGAARLSYNHGLAATMFAGRGRT